MSVRKCLHGRRSNFFYYGASAVQASKFIFGTSDVDFPDPLVGLRAAESPNCAVCNDCAHCIQPELCKPKKYAGLCVTDVDLEHRLSVRTAAEQLVNSNDIYWVREPAVLYTPFVPDNYGHILADDLLSVFSALRVFGFNPRESRLIQTHRKPNDEFTLKWEARLHSLLSQFQVQGLNELTGMSTIPPENHDTRVKVCFKKLVAGTAALGMKSLRGRYQELHALRSHLLRSPNIGRHLPRPRAHLITLMSKVGRRKWLNAKETAEHLRNMFPSIEVIELRAGNEETHDESDISSWDLQLSVLLRTSLFISIEGCVSFNGFFLPQGAAAILIDFFNPETGKGKTMNPHFWNSMPHVLDMHYPVQKEDVDFGSIPSGCASGTNLSKCTRDEFEMFNDISTSMPVMTQLVLVGLDFVRKQWNLDLPD